MLNLYEIKNRWKTSLPEMILKRSRREVFELINEIEHNRKRIKELEKVLIFKDNLQKEIVSEIRKIFDRY